MLILVLGFVGGFVTATAWSVRQPVELIISTPSLPETVAATSGDEVWSESRNISVRTPRPNTIVVSPLTVEGLARLNLPAKDGNLGGIVVRLKDGKDNELAKVATTGTAPDVGIHGPYRAQLTFETPKTRTGTLEVFQALPKDGGEIDKVVVLVKFE